MTIYLDFMQASIQDRPRKGKAQMNSVTLPAGNGFYETDHYPIGGSFHRSKADLVIAVERMFPTYHGVNAEGWAEDGRKVAFDISSTRPARCPICGVPGSGDLHTPTCPGADQEV